MVEQDSGEFEGCWLFIARGGGSWVFAMRDDCLVSGSDC